MFSFKAISRETVTLLLLASSAAQAQTTTPAPATPAPTTPAPAAAPATTKPATPTSAATNRTVSALSVGISQAVKGQLIKCPAAFKVSTQAVCLYVKSGLNTLKPSVRGAVGSRAYGEWKNNAQNTSSSLLLQEGGKITGFVLMSTLSAQESLVIVDAARASATPPAAAAPQVKVPTGAVKGLPYLLDTDLAGVVNVIDLGSGKYRLNAAGQTALTINVGSKTAQRAGGSVQLPQTPLTDGRYLLFPVENLRALGCTVTDAANGITIGCGSDSVGVKPIVF